MGAMVAAFLLEMSAEPDGAAEGERRVARSMEAVGEDPMLLGYLAMTAQDRGDLDTAHRLASRSLELDPTGFAGGHPISHVYFETGRPRERAVLARRLAADDRPEGDVRPAPGLARRPAPPGARRRRRGARHATRDCGGSTAGGRLIDGPSLLWRCQLLGHVPPGTDPETPRVSDLARDLMDGVPFIFLGVHVALALATAGDADGLRRFAHNARGFDAAGRPRRCCPTWPAGWRPSSRATTPRRPRRCCASSRTSGTSAARTRSVRSSRTPSSTRWCARDGSTRQRPGCASASTGASLPWTRGSWRRPSPAEALSCRP